MKKIIKNKWFYIPAIIVAVAIVIMISRGNGDTREYVQVVRSDVREEVSVSGKVKPVQSVSLSFETGGRVASVLAEVGDIVVAGQSLVRLDTTADVIALRKAQATLDADRATLAELKSGTRPEDIAILQSKLDAADMSYGQERQSLVDTLKDAYTDADNSVRNYADQFFSNPRTSPQLNISTTDNQLKVKIENLRFGVESVLVSWSSSIHAITVSSDLIMSAQDSRSNLELVKELLDSLSLVVNGLSTTQSLSETTIATYRSNIATARSAVNTALSSVSTGEESLSSALASLDLAEKNLALAFAGTIPEKITAQEANVEAGVASVAAIQHTLSNSVLRSPIDGLVALQDAKVGEVVAMNKTIASVISESALEIEAFVPEVDIGAMAIGNTALITFDAFPEEEITGSVSYIDPAETVIDGVPTYKIRLAMESADSRVRSGMTANLSITVAEHAGVLSIPYRALGGSSGNRFILLRMPDDTLLEVPVETGIRGTSGEIEIIAGAVEGSTIAVPER